MSMKITQISEANFDSKFLYNKFHIKKKISNAKYPRYACGSCNWSNEYPCHDRVSKKPPEKIERTLRKLEEKLSFVEKAKKRLLTLGKNAQRKFMQKFFEIKTQLIYLKT